MTGPALVRVRGLAVAFGSRRAVDGLDLELGLGVHGLLGPNGAGKTTLVRVLATVLAPTAGAVEVLGRDLGDEPGLREVRRRLGYLPQVMGAYPRLRVREFVEYVAWLKEVPTGDVPLAVDRALERVGMLDRAEDRMKHLSGGMLRRVGLAQAVVNDPELLLLDEPTAGLDPEQRVRFRELLRELGVDTCVIVSTHLVEDVAAACNDVTLVAGGRTRFHGTPAELAAAGASGTGDSPLERGYTAVLQGSAPRRRGGA